MSINITFRDSDAGHVAIRQLALGMQPMVLIEPAYDEETDEAEFNLDVTDLDREGLASVLRLLADSLNEAVPVETEETP